MKSTNRTQIIFLAVIGVLIIAGTIIIINRLKDYSVISTNEAERQQLNESIEKQDAMETTELKTETLKEGTGEGAKAGQEISVHYTGTLTNGTKFDSSRDRNEPFTFKLGSGQVIAGWDQGLVGMKVGEVRKLTIPASMGYKDQAVGSIPANSTLIFEVEMVSIK